MENNYSMLLDPEMREIVDGFLVETKEILANLDVNLINLEKEPKDVDLLNDIFRSFHTIKGTSGFLGLEKLTRVTHKCEDILNKLRKGESILNSDIMDGILYGFDKIKELLICIEANLNEEVDIDESLEILGEVIGKMNDSDSVKSSIETGETEKSDPVLEVVEDVQQLQPAPSQENNNIKSATQNDKTLRVDVERLDDLLNIASELVLGRNQLIQLNSEISGEYEGTKLAKDLSEATRLIDLMTNELQLVVMKTRMVKIGKVFNRFPRLIRDLAKSTNKNIELIIHGEDTELDKTLTEEIYDPLVHLIRNSVDHGIESSEERKKSGKSEQGKIILSAEQEGNNIIISVEDDGKGIDTEILKEKAIQKGLITSEKAKDLTKQEAYNLIFLPGFSTRDEVSNISGRGVGMDVVKTNVAKLRGIISIDSTVGGGTKIIIKLPLTLAIIPGMIVRVGNELLVIPLNSIIEVVRIQVKEIQTVNRQEVINIRDNVLPLLEIKNLLYATDDKLEDKVWQYIVVVGVAERRFGIKVDELKGQKEVVIKSLGKFLGNIEGIAGSTIMGDGTVVMILDLSELLNRLN